MTILLCPMLVRDVQAPSGDQAKPSEPWVVSQAGMCSLIAI